MAASFPKLLALCALSLLLAEAMAAPRLSHEPIDFTADSFQGDNKSRSTTWRKVRIVQGNIVLTADLAQSSGTGVEHAFDDSRWVFRGAVRLSMDDALLNAEEAQVTFVANALTLVVANGKPANFQQRIEKTGKLAQGHSDNLEYDVTKGIIRLSNDAWLSYNDNETRAPWIRYNLTAQTIEAEGNEQINQRVHIVIPPPPPKSKPPTP